MRLGVLIAWLVPLVAVVAGCGSAATADSVVITHVDISKRASDLIRGRETLDVAARKVTSVEMRPD